MSLDNPDPLENVAKGATEGALNYLGMSLKTLVKKFLDKDFSFTEDEEVINLAKKQRKKAEWDLFKTYVKDGKLHILFQMGLTLRDLEKDGKDLVSLKNKIRTKYKREGLHVAYFVQNGLFGKLIANIIGRFQTTEEIKSEIENILGNIDKNVEFIDQYDNEKQTSDEIVTKVRAHSPETFIISSVGSAIDVCVKIKENVMGRISENYTCEVYEDEDKNKRIYFLNRKNI